MSKWLKIVLGSALALLLAVGACTLWAVHRSLMAVRDSYAQWDLALATIEYMKKNTGAWPPDWSSLHVAYTTTPNLRGPGPWEDVTNRVDMDFNVNPSLLATQTLRVIWLRSGRTQFWAGSEPNELIREYLVKGSAEPTGAANSASPHR